MGIMMQERNVLKCVYFHDISNEFTYGPVSHPRIGHVVSYE